MNFREIENLSSEEIEKQYDDLLEIDENSDFMVRTTIIHKNVYCTKYGYTENYHVEDGWMSPCSGHSYWNSLPRYGYDCSYFSYICRGGCAYFYSEKCIDS